MSRFAFIIPMLFCGAGLLFGPEERRLELVILIAAMLICTAILSRDKAA